MSTIRLILAIPVRNNMRIRQVDIPTAFLNEKLQSEIYIKIPEEIKNKREVLKLKRALYGLQQSLKYWNDEFDKFVIGSGFTRSLCDICLYILQTE